MKAVGLTEFGGPEVLQALELPVPGEVRIRVRAAAVNPIDTMVRRGVAFVADAEPPYVPGMDAAGVVEQIGEGSTQTSRRATTSWPSRSCRARTVRTPSTWSSLLSRWPASLRA